MQKNPYGFHNPATVQRDLGAYRAADRFPNGHQIRCEIAARYGLHGQQPSLVDRALELMAGGASHAEAFDRSVTEENARNFSWRRNRS